MEGAEFGAPTLLKTRAVEKMPGQRLRPGAVLPNAFQKPQQPPQPQQQPPWWAGELPEEILPQQPPPTAPPVPPYTLTKNDWNRHYLLRFGWLRKERSSHAPLNPIQRKAHLEGLVARALERCRVHTSSAYANGSFWNNELRGMQDGDDRAAALERIVNLNQMLMHSASQLSKALSEIRIYRERFVVKPAYSWLPLNSENFVALYDDNFFGEDRYTRNDKALINNLRMYPGPDDVAVNRHELLWARSPTGVVDANGDPLLTPDKQDQSATLNLSPQFRADMDFYVQLSNVFIVCEAWENAMFTAILKLSDPTSKVDDVQYFLDALYERTLDNFRSDEPDNPAFVSGPARDAFARGYAPVSERGRRDRYEVLKLRIQAVVSDDEGIWDVYGKKLKHLLYRNEGLIDEDGRLEFTRRRVKQRFRAELMQSADKLLYIKLFVESVDAVGMLTDEDREAGALTEDAWKEGITLPWDEYSFEQLWTIDAIIWIITERDENMGINKEGQNLEQEAVGLKEFEGMRRRTENEFKLVFEEKADYTRLALRVVRRRAAEARQLELERATANEQGDQELVAELTQRIETLTWWKQPERDRKKAQGEKANEQKKRVREGDKAKKKQTLAGLRPIFYETGNGGEPELMGYEDPETQRIYPDGSADLKDEVDRRNQGIPRKYWDRNERNWTPGDKRRLEPGGKLFPLPSETPEDVDLNTWEAWVAEYKATLQIKAGNEAKEAEARFKERELEQYKAQYQGFTIRIANGRGGYLKATSAAQRDLVQSQIQRLVNVEEEAAMASEEYVERKRQRMEDERQRWEERRLLMEESILKEREHAEWLAAQKALLKEWPVWPPPPPPPPPPFSNTPAS